MVSWIWLKKAQETKEKINFIKVKNIYASLNKPNNEKITHRMGEKIWKSYTW